MALSTGKGRRIRTDSDASGDLGEERPGSGPPPDHEWEERRDDQLYVERPERVDSRGRDDLMEKDT